MDRRELYRKYGFDNTTIQNAIFTNYRPYIRKHLDSMFIDASVIQVDEIIEDVIAQLPQLDMECDIDILVFDCLRKRLTVLLRTDRIQPKPTKKLLSEYHKYILSDSTETYSVEELECIFSCFRRKMFTYLIDRYFYFNDSIMYDNIEEKAIRKLFEGKGDVRPLYLWNRWKPHIVTSETYMYALDQIPLFFLNQISGKGELIPHPKSVEYSVLKTRFLVRQKALPIIIVLFFLSMIVLLLQALLG